MSYVNETDFVIENKELVYPEVITDGLQLYYDAKGKRDTDYHRDTMLDMSGNKNHGKLHNFAYEKHSGYKDGLVFDYIDDKLIRPALNLQPDDFTFMLNGNIISFSPDGTVKRVQDGEVIESKGFNLIRNGDFVDGTSGWMQSGYRTGFEVIGGVAKTIDSPGDNRSFIQTLSEQQNTGDIIYVSINTKVDNPDKLNNMYVLSDYASRPDTNIIGPVTNVGTELIQLSGVVRYNGVFNLRVLYNFTESGVYPAYIKDVIALNLTQSFGAGKEPTKEQMDEIINQFGFIPNAQDLIDRIEYKGNDLGDMENIIDGLYKTEVLSGEEVYTDKADDAVVHVEVDGRSYQHAGNGKNLFAVPYPDALKDFIRPNDYWVKPITLKANTQYTVSSKLIGNRIEGTTVMVWSGGDRYADRGRSYATLSVNGTDIEVTFNTEDNTDWKIAIYLKNDLESSKELLGELLDNYQIQLEEGSVVTEYEPPAPTPDYPIEIHSLNGFDVVSSVGKENLLSHKNMGRYIGGNLDNYSNTNYELIGDIYYIKNNPIYSLVGFKVRNPKDFVTFSGLTSYSNIRIFYRGFDLNGNETVRQTAFSVPSGNGEFMVTSRLEEEPNTEYYNIGIGVEGSSGNGGWIKPKLSKGSKLSDWSPSPKDIIENDSHPLIDKINLLLSEPLRSIGDVKDRLFRDSDGAWKIERNVAIVSVADISSWVSVAERYHTAVTSQIGGTPSVIAKRGTQPISSHFKTGAHAGAGDDVGISVVGNFPQFRIKFNNNVIGVKPDATATERVEIMRNWINNNSNTVIQYERDEKLVEILPQSLQDKLNNLRSFEESNYVHTVLSDENNILSENIKPTLHAKFLYNNWYKEDRVINNLMIYNRALTSEEMLQNYKTIKRRWGM